jgi:creatinine amidohydrolase/Fe(II)-dependent formamide hydrolase-like protein/predicted nucleic acid-binding protein
VRGLLDTSVLIGGTAPQDIEAAISVASLAELHFGVLIAAGDDERALRTQRLGAIESTFDPLPVTAEIAREWGRLAAAVRTRGGRPRRRTMDLAIAATANVHRVPLLTENVGDFQIISDLVDVRTPRLGGLRSGAHALAVGGHGEVHVFEQLTSSALRELVERGVTTAVVPFGSIEHHDSHLPVGADALLAEAVGRELARRLGALLLPTYRVGHAPAHRERWGTLTLEAGTLTEVAVAVAHGLARNGALIIALISTHGGNTAPLDAAIEQLNGTLGRAVACAPRGDPGPEPGTHSGEWLTSVMLALAPQLVHLEAASGDLASELSRACPERGQQHLDRFVRALVDGVQAAGNGPRP